MAGPIAGEHIASARWVVVPVRPGVIQFNLGQVLGERGRPEQAIPHVKESLRIRPDVYGATLHLGVALTASGNPAEAATVYRRALASTSAWCICTVAGSPRPPRNCRKP